MASDKILFPKMQMQFIAKMVLSQNLDLAYKFVVINSTFRTNYNSHRVNHTKTNLDDKENTVWISYYLLKLQ